MTERLAYCKVNISPVRAENKDQAEMVSQLLFGEILHVYEINGSWCRITTFSDNYSGWTDLKHVGFLSDKEVSRWMDGMITETKMIRPIQTPWGKQWITRGACVPSDNSGSFNIGNDSFFFFDEPKSKTYLHQYELAMEYLNTPYLWGGKSPFGIDCSGLSQMVFRATGINLPRDAAQQAEHAREIDFTEAAADDLAFFSNESGKVTHVGIVIPDNRIIHASGRVRIDTLTREGIYSEEQEGITHRLSSIRRF